MLGSIAGFCVWFGLLSPAWLAASPSHQPHAGGALGMGLLLAAVLAFSAARMWRNGRWVRASLATVGSLAAYVAACRLTFWLVR